MKAGIMKKDKTDITAPISSLLIHCLSSNTKRKALLTSIMILLCSDTYHDTH